MRFIHPEHRKELFIAVPIPPPAARSGTPRDGAFYTVLAKELETMALRLSVIASELQNLAELKKS